MSGAARGLHWLCQRVVRDGYVTVTIKESRDWDRKLQLFPVNEECLVDVSHQLTSITSLPFVHTARRCPGLSCFQKGEDGRQRSSDRRRLKLL